MTTNNSATPRLQVKGIRKTFGQNAVLKGIDLSVDAGEVVALTGGNGAGKSTLMKIIMGIYTCDEGEVLIDGKAVKLGKPSASLAQGIYLVPQEPMLFPNMTVLENILMGFNEKEGELKKRLNDCMQELNFNLNLQRKANTLSIAEQQLVELLRGMMRNARILILDEPTSSLTFNEVQSLFKTVEDLKKKGIAIIYITHRLTEVFEIATHVAIMRDGVITLDGPVKNFTKEMLIQGLLPNDSQTSQQAAKAYEPVDYAHLKPVMQVQNFSGYGFSNITFDLYPGEILGIAGVVGAGRTELCMSIFGHSYGQKISGDLYLNGKKTVLKTVHQAIESGLAYVTEDRKGNGLVLGKPIRENTTMARMEKICSRHGVIDFDKEKAVADEYCKKFKTKCDSIEQNVGNLSGGNQQKVLLAKWMFADPDILILDEPTRGIDVGAKYEIYGIMNQMVSEGKSVIMISSEMPELLGMCDRIYVMNEGRIVGEFSSEEVTQEKIMTAILKNGTH